MRRPAHDADIAGAQADQLGLVRHQHHIITVARGEAGQHVAVAIAFGDVADALPAAARLAIFERRTALAKAIGGHRQDELLGRRELPHAGFRKHALARLILPGRGLQIILALFRAGGKALQDRHRHDLIARAQRHAAHTGGGAGNELAHIINGEADGLATLGGQEHIIGLVAQRHADQPVIIAFFKADGELAGGRHAGETVHGVAAHATMRRGKHHVQAAPFGLVLR